MSARTVHLGNAALVAVLFALSAMARSGLPERIPVHFGPGGTPTRWADTSSLAWYGLPAVAALTALLLWGAGRLARTHPSLWNVPEKDRFVRLSPAAREPLNELLERILGGVGVLVTLTFAAVQLAIHRTAVGGAGAAGGWLQLAIWAPMLAMVVLAFFATRGTGARIRAAAEAEGIEPRRWKRTPP